MIDDFFLGTKLYNKQLAIYCKPLADYLGITHAVYVNIDKQGRSFNICTHVGWQEWFLQEQYYQLDPLMVHPNNIHNGFCFDNASEDQEFKDALLHDAAVKFNCCHTFVYVEKNASNGYYAFSFATNKENFQIYNRLMNEWKIIKKAIRDIHRNLMLTISKDLQENKMDFAALKGELFYNQKGLIFNEQHETAKKIELLKNIGILSDKDKNFLRDVTLSAQEINCLRSYLTNPNFKKVARELNLAPNTVASYMENIKVKLNCNSKNQLLEKGEILEALGHI